MQVSRKRKVNGKNVAKDRCKDSERGRGIHPLLVAGESVTVCDDG